MNGKFLFYAIFVVAVTTWSSWSHLIGSSFRSGGSSWSSGGGGYYGGGGGGHK